MPLDHANPSTNVTISMFYAITTPTIPLEFKRALVIIPGGPGGALLTHHPAGITSFQLVNELQRPVILFDPRGTGNGSRLNCSLQQKPLSLHLDIDLFDIRRCLSEIGDEVFHYSATAIVNDLELLRIALGFKKWDLFGYSYGGLISQVYGLLYPNSIGSMLLDSPVPMRDKDLYQVRNHEAYARIYAEKHRENPKFSMESFSNQLKSVLWRLRWNRALREDLKIDPRLLYHVYRFTPDSFPEAIASAADDRNYTGLQALAEEFDPRLVPLRNWSIAMAVSTTCNTIVDLFHGTPTQDSSKE